MQHLLTVSKRDKKKKKKEIVIIDSHEPCDIANQFALVAP